MPAPPEFLNLKTAAEYGGFPSVAALQQYVYRYNLARPEELRIIRRHGRVHFETFAKALRAETYTRPDPAKQRNGAAAIKPRMVKRQRVEINAG